MSKEGFWSVQYDSRYGNGFAMIALETQRVVGADCFGGSWDGTYEYDPRGDQFHVTLTILMPSGIISALTGAEAPLGGSAEKIEFAMPNSFDEQPLKLRTETGELNAKLRKIRNWPD